MSTLLAAEAVRRNKMEGIPCSFIAIEPYPREFLRRGVPGLTELLETKVQSVPASSDFVRWKLTTFSSSIRAMWSKSGGT